MSGSISIGRGLAILAFAGCVLVAVGLIKPAVPNEIRLLAGPSGSTFYQNGLRYKELLAGHGITVHVEETRGSLENLKRLAEADRPTAAFGGAIEVVRERKQDVPDHVFSLGTLYLEPLWIFSGRGTQIDSLMDLEGSRIAPGREGSGARVLAMFLFEAAGIDDDVQLVPTLAAEPQSIIAALQADQVRAVVAAGEPGSLLIDPLLRSASLRVVSIPRIEALALRYSFLSRVRLPRGAHDLKADIPDRDLELLASGTELLISDPFPPALADLLLEAAEEIHGEATLFWGRGDFPNPDMASLPLSRAATHYYTDGPSVLRRWLPFRLATLADRFLLMAATIASAAVAIFTIVPAVLKLSFNAATGRVYRRLEAVEKSLTADFDRKKTCAELDELNRITAAMRVPMRSLEAPWFELRQNLHDLRDRVESQGQSVVE